MHAEASRYLPTSMRLTVNHQRHDVDAAPHETLLAVLRDRLHLTGAKLVCGRGECGACTVLVDGAPTYACLALAIACEGSEVTTIEGIGTTESLHPLQRAFVAEDALQCGYCTPGQILAAIALLARDPDPDEPAIRRGMSGNLCRCGTYPKIVRAVRAAAREMGRPDAG
jgi:aerobic-type carbon monoxide dehydrogenase small subunit (CoxS/CutS family)